MDPKPWRQHIEPTQKLYSWVMNNHWYTNYCAYQEGVVTFRYALRPHGEYEPAIAERFATGLTQPLIVDAACGPAPEGTSLLRVEPVDVLVTALKPSADGKALIVRLFGASGQDRQAKLSWSSPRAAWISNLSEKALSKVGDTIPVPGWGVVTLRVEGGSEAK
jgi:alpha-mannosidase